MCCIAPHSGEPALSGWSLAKSHPVEGQIGTVEPNVGDSDSAATTIELSVELGELSYYEALSESVTCRDLLHAPMHVRVSIGGSLLRFAADGVLWQRESQVSAWLYASTNLANGTGTLEPNLDASGVDTGDIEISMYVSPGQFRGDICAAVHYFEATDQLARRQAGDRTLFTDRQTLLQIAFPIDECEAHELPFAPDQPIETLNRQTAEKIRALSLTRIDAPTTVAAVWSNGAEAEMSIDPGPPIRGMPCLKSFEAIQSTPPQAGWELRIPIAGLMRSNDARFELPINDLIVRLDESISVSKAILRARIPVARLNDETRRSLDMEVDQVSAKITYDFVSVAGGVDGIVYFREQTEPGLNRPIDCFAFPVGGRSDAGESRYSRNAR